MAKYSIKELESLSGIKAHTLRIWEKRYDLFHPERSITNIRYYSDEDLKKLLNISLLCSAGIKISRIAEMNEAEIKQTILDLETEEDRTLKKIDDFVKAMLDMDETAFNTAFDRCINTLGYKKTITEIIFPFLRKVGMLWLSDDIQPLHEHFTTQLIRNRMLTEISKLANADKGKKAVLFLPEDEFHELGLVFVYFLLKSAGIKVYYLGQSTPFSEVQSLVDSIEVDFLFSSSSFRNKRIIHHLLQDYANIAGVKKYYLEPKAQRILKLHYPKEIHKILELEELLKAEGE